MFGISSICHFFNLFSPEGVSCGLQWGCWNILESAGQPCALPQSPLSPAAGTLFTWQIPCENQGGLREQRLRWEEEDPKKASWVPWGLVRAGAEP